VEVSDADVSRGPKKGTRVHRLGVMAHFDHDGRLGPHTRRQVAALAAAVDDLLVVTTADLTSGAREFLGSHARVIERPNVGYDFLSYKVGLESADLSAYDEVTVCNDSYVGPLTDYALIFDHMSSSKVDFWGLTETDRVSHHVQSFFITFRPTVVASEEFGRFWSEMVPLSHRYKVIRRYEVGLSRRLYGAGFTSAPYFVETDEDRKMARRRVRWWALRRTGVPTTPSDVALLRKRSRVAWNPSLALADRALDAGRLPYVKIDTLRYDSYDLGADRLLTLCEQRFPDAFSGVREFLQTTSHHYPPRPNERLASLPRVLRPARRLVEYRPVG
jgi:lipopolysaccharide biosynthesis protein